MEERKIRQNKKRTKIVATIGPASDSKDILRELIQAGMDVCRINFSHGTHETNGKVITRVRELSEELYTPVGILADLQGPRVRTIVEVEEEIKNGEKVLVYDISKKPEKTELKMIGLDWSEIIKDINVGENILIEDGLKHIRVVEKNENFLVAEVVNGGIIKNHKGVNFPDSKLKIGVMTKKDEEDLAYALSRGVDFIALSFVGSGKEIRETREKMKKILGRENDLPQIIAKIERKEAIKNIDEIISVADAIMVARGDLGIEMDETKVVIYQKEIIAKCTRAVRPVIVATQMLESMIQSPIPTRAEVSDVSNAVIDHTDAVMLSGESANGKFPREAVAIMSQIILDTEDSRFDDVRENTIPRDDEDQDYISLVEGACNLAKKSNAKAIIAVTISGFTGRLLAHFRPVQENFVVTISEKVYNQLSLVWGVRSCFLENVPVEKLIEQMLAKLKEENKIEKKDKVVIIFGRIPEEEKTRMVELKEIV